MQAAISVIKSAPPVATGVLLLFGLPISQWALIASFIYTSLLIGGVIYDRLKKNKFKPQPCPVCGHYHNRETDPKDHI